MFFSLCPSLLVKISLFRPQFKKHIPHKVFSQFSLILFLVPLDLYSGTYPILLCCCNPCVPLSHASPLLGPGSWLLPFWFPTSPSESLQHRKGGTKKTTTITSLSTHCLRVLRTGCHKSHILEILLFCRRRTQSTNWEVVVCGRVSLKTVAL